MIDYLLSSQAPGKDAALAGTGLPSIIANIALVVGAILFKPAVERHFGLAIDEHTPLCHDNRQCLKVILDARHDLLSPALDSLSTLHLKVKPVKVTIATAVTVVKNIPTPVQKFQEQSTMGAILGIFACVTLALAGTALVFPHYREGSYFSVTSSSAANSDNGSSSPQSTSPPTDDFSDEDESSGSGGRTPPIPIFDIFYDGPISHADKAVDTRDEVGDMDGAPPPPPPSFPTPVEDGDAFKRKPSIFKWLSLTLVLSIISLVINRLFSHFFKGHGKTQKKFFTPTASECITVNKISENAAIPLPSATAKTAISLSTCLNMLPLVENESTDVGISTLITSTVSQRSREFRNVVFSSLVMACLVLYPLIAQCFLDDHLEGIIKHFFPTKSRGQSFKALNVVEITHSTDESTSIEDENIAADLIDNVTDGEDVAVDIEEEDIVVGIDGEDVTGTDEVAAGTNVATGGDEEIDDEMKNFAEQEISFSNVGDTTLVVYEKALPLGVSLEDNLNTSEDGAPIHEVFSALSISSSSDEIHVFKETSESSTNPMFKLPIKLEKKTVGGSQDIKVLPEHVPKLNIPVVAEQIQTVSQFALEKTVSVAEKVSSTVKVDITSKENVPTVNVNKASASASAKTLPVPVKNRTTKTKTSSTEALNPKAPSFVPPSHLPMRVQPGQSSSTSLHYCYSPPFSTRPGLSASMHAPSSQRKDLSASIHAPSSPPREILSASFHAPSSPRRPDSSTSIHAPCTPPQREASNASNHNHTPIEDELELPMVPIPIPVVDLSPDRRIRRTIDPLRESDVTVLVGGDS